MSHMVSKPILGREEVQALAAVIDSGWITQGPRVDHFERLLASFLGAEHVVACSTGTAALHLALACARIGTGDEVLVPDLTYVATGNAVLYCGATPVLVDVDPQTWTIDLEDAERKITRHTKAIMPVDLYGMPYDVERARRLAEAHSLVVIEDAAEGLGGAWRGQHCGTLGDFGTFSFYANKVITTGEGGAVVVKTASDLERLRLLRGQAQHPERRYFHVEIGFNYRMSELQGALGCAQLARVDSLLERRLAIIHAYRDQLAGHVQVQDVLPPRMPAPWLFTCVLPRTVKRGKIVEELAIAGIETRPAFTPLHRMPMFGPGYDDQAFPAACGIADRGISLPTHPELTKDDALYIAERLRRAL